MSSTYRCASFIGYPTITVECEQCGATAETKDGKRPRPKHSENCPNYVPKPKEAKP